MQPTDPAVGSYRTATGHSTDIALATDIRGPDGPRGNPGPGIAAGGTAGQLLSKKSGTDYDTEWVDFNPDHPTVAMRDYNANLLLRIAAAATTGASGSWEVVAQQVSGSGIPTAVVSDQTGGHMPAAVSGQILLPAGSRLRVRASGATVQLDLLFIPVYADTWARVGNGENIPKRKYFPDIYDSVDGTTYSTFNTLLASSGTKLVDDISASPGIRVLITRSQAGASIPNTGDPNRVYITDELGTSAATGTIIPNDGAGAGVTFHHVMWRQGNELWGGLVRTSTGNLTTGGGFRFQRIIGVTYTPKVGTSEDDIDNRVKAYTGQASETAVFALARVPVLSVAKIPNLDASKTTTGVFAAARLPDAGTATKGAVVRSTDAEVQAGTNDAKYTTPKGVKAAIDNPIAFTQNSATVSRSLTQVLQAAVNRAIADGDLSL